MVEAGFPEELRDVVPPVASWMDGNVELVGWSFFERKRGKEEEGEKKRREEGKIVAIVSCVGQAGSDLFFNQEKSETHQANRQNRPDSSSIASLTR